MPVVADVELRIVEGDALSYPADLLVLKHAQALYGLDERVVALAGLRKLDFPVPGDHRLVTTPAGVRADAVLFLGVTDLGQFEYPEIREFAERALAVAADARPQAQEIALTVHGAGYGLDESESFTALIAGLLDALTVGTHPASLRTVAIVEQDHGRAKRLHDHLVRLLRGTHAAVPASSPDLYRAGRRNTSREHAFVAMPFDDGFDDVFHYGISRAVHENGLLCERVDQQTFTGDVVRRIRRQIQSARLLIADVTGANANVYLEIGFAWGVRVPTVLLVRDGTELLFDIRGQRCLFYTSIKNLEQKLTAEVRGLLSAS